jgi:hypothetical protein
MQMFYFVQYTRTSLLFVGGETEEKVVVMTMQWKKERKVKQNFRPSRK